MALVALTLGFQPEIVPSSVANMKILGPDFPFALTTNSFGFVLFRLLKTLPVGAAVVPAGLPAGGGIVTTRGEPTGNGGPSPPDPVPTPLPLSEAPELGR